VPVLCPRARARILLFVIREHKIIGIEKGDKEEALVFEPLQIYGTSVYLTSWNSPLLASIKRSLARSF
jgi:hypothetical protein